MNPLSPAPSRASPSYSVWKASAHLTKPLARLSAREIYIHPTFLEKYVSKGGVDLKILPGNSPIMNMYRQTSLEQTNFIFLSIILEIDWEIQTVVPRL
jgi:hypothetical protein